MLSSFITAKFGTGHDVHHIFIAWNSDRSLAVQQVTQHVRLARLKQAQLPVDRTRLVLAAILRCQHFFGVSPRIRICWLLVVFLMHHHASIVSNILAARLCLQEHDLLFWIPILNGLYKLSRSHHSLWTSWCGYTSVRGIGRHATGELIGDFHFVAHASFVQYNGSCISLVANEIIFKPWLPSNFFLPTRDVTVTSFDVLWGVWPFKMATVFMIFYDLHTWLERLISAVPSIIITIPWNF